MDYGFVILSPDRNVAGLKNTLGSIRFYSYNRQAICIVDEDAPSSEVKEMKKMCDVYKGENTLTSLINAGMKKNKHEWAFIMFAGSRIPPSLEYKLDLWAKKDSDVVFPVVDRKWQFVEGSFNGVFINKKFFNSVGDFPTATMKKQGFNDFELAKMFWAVDALDKGCTFKAIVGMKVI